MGICSTENLDENESGLGDSESVQSAGDLHNKLDLDLNDIATQTSQVHHCITVMIIGVSTYSHLSPRPLHLSTRSTIS